ncbi:hypothetical protein AM587_10004425 [Phytophthora nicotianae]|uniref:Endonuclease III protein 1 n=1 Tax=Phytophthora nicotianae TaxID=4792 RepID=A0A0W8BZF6_PHYNI|nr:hypothetical protein AM587_10004425 [Phytophthora nicotianae]KUF92361.1 Endonuclease III protein 1 [Phytophthora nicotianae]
MYKKEIKKMHQRVRMYSDKTNKLFLKLYDIEKLDFIKYKLSELNSDRSYRQIASDVQYKDQLEYIFDLPFDEIESAYVAMVYRRNAIVHKYTMRQWSGEKVPIEIKRITRKTRAAWQLN